MPRPSYKMSNHPRTIAGNPLPGARRLCRDVRFKARFWSKVRIGKRHECWEWQASLNRPGGYGKFRLGKSGTTMYNAHRVAYMLRHRRWPDPCLMILHSCDNPRCVNPGHLTLGTAEDNNRDTVAKGRWSCGVESWKRGYPPQNVLRSHSVLTPDNVRHVRSVVQSVGGIEEAKRLGTLLVLAIDLDTTEQALINAATGKTFAWVIGSKGV